jgi:hypothetical protein
MKPTTYIYSGAMGGRASDYWEKGVVVDFEKTWATKKSSISNPF